MSAKSVEFGDPVRAKVVRGACRLVDTVAVTLGPAGRTVVLDRGGRAPRVSKDGLTVAREIEWADPFEELGARIIREAALEAGRAVGDGTTTVLVLAAAMVREGMKFVIVGMDPMGVARGMHAAVAVACRELDRLSTACASREATATIATIAANGDAALGQLVASALHEVGRHGMVSAQPSASDLDELVIDRGARIACGYLSPHFVPEGRGEARLDNPLIVVCDGKVTDAEGIVRVMELAMHAGSPLLVLAHDVEGPALATLLANARRGSIQVCAIRAPGIGERRGELLEDVATLVGATIVGEGAGSSLSRLESHQLGRAAAVTVSSDKTFILQGRGDAALAARRVEQVERRLREARSEGERENLEARAGFFAGRAAVIKLRGATETELQERLDRADGAVRAARAALEEGIVPGGGVALLRCGASVRALKSSTEEERAGHRVVLRALEEPIRQLATNRGDAPTVVMAKVASQSGDFGYDAATGHYGNMVHMGVLDPAKVCRIALQSAASVAAIILTTGCAVASGSNAAADIQASA